MKSRGQGIIRLANNRFVARKQHEHDCYETPAWCVESLLRRVPEIREAETILEPCCGAGSIVRELRRLLPDVTVLASDIRDGDQIVGVKGIDFLDGPLQWQEGCCSWVVVNPPFRKSTKFLLRSLEIATEGVAVFQRTQWLESKGRYRDIWSTQPCTDVLPFVERVGCFQEGEMEDPKQGGMLAFAWFVFRKGYEGHPQIRWIDDKPDFTNDTRMRKEPNENLPELPERGALDARVLQRVSGEHDRGQSVRVLRDDQSGDGEMPGVQEVGE